MKILSEIVVKALSVAVVFIFYMGSIGIPFLLIITAGGNMGIFQLSNWQHIEASQLLAFAGYTMGFLVFLVMAYNTVRSAVGAILYSDQEFEEDPDELE